MFGNFAKKGVIVGVVGLGVSVLGAGPATAAGSTVVLSDKISYAAQANPGPVAGVYNLQSVHCSLVSDHDPTTGPCQITGQLKKTSTGFSGTATVASNDGNTQWSFTLTVSGTNFKMTGKGKETDTPDPGTPPPPSYLCTVKGHGTITPNAAGGFNLSGLTVISEKSTQP